MDARARAGVPSVFPRGGPEFVCSSLAAGARKGRARSSAGLHSGSRARAGAARRPLPAYQRRVYFPLCISGKEVSCVYGFEWSFFAPATALSLGFQTITTSKSPPVSSGMSKPGPDVHRAMVVVRVFEA